MPPQVRGPDIFGENMRKSSALQMHVLDFRCFSASKPQRIKSKWVENRGLILDLLRHWAVLEIRGSVSKENHCSKTEELQYTSRGLITAEILQRDKRQSSSARRFFNIRAQSSYCTSYDYQCLILHGRRPINGTRQYRDARFDHFITKIVSV